MAYGEKQLLVGCKDGLKYYNSHDLADLQSEDERHKDATVAEHNGELFLLEISQDNTEMLMRLENNNEWDKCFKFPQETDYFLGVTVSDDYIACTDKDETAVWLWDRNRHPCPGKEMFPKAKLQNCQRIYNLHFKPDGTLLATVRKSCKKWKLYNFTIERENYKIEATKNWSSPLPAECSGIASASNGFIFVSGMVNKTVYIISPEGLYKISFF